MVVVMMVVAVPIAVMIVGMRIPRADTLHVMMVALLREPDLIFETKHLGAILAATAIHCRVAGEYLLGPLLEGFDQQRMVIEIRRLDELDFRMAPGDAVGVLVDAIDENAGEEKIREHDGAFEAEAGGVFEPRFDERKRHAGIDRLAPAKSEALPQQTHHLGHISVGVRVRCATADDDE